MNPSSLPHGALFCLCAAAHHASPAVVILPCQAAALTVGTSPGNPSLCTPWPKEGVIYPVRTNGPFLPPLLHSCHTEPPLPQWHLSDCIVTCLLAPHSTMQGQYLCPQYLIPVSPEV